MRTKTYVPIWIGAKRLTCQCEACQNPDSEYGGCGITETTIWDDCGYEPSWNDVGFNRLYDEWPGIAECERLSPTEAAADYYLLEVVRHDLLQMNAPASIREQAIRMFTELVEKWDEVFVTYLSMAIGGELRHHRALRGKILSTERINAWMDWKPIWDKEGVGCLDTVAELFSEADEGSDVCGEPWAQAARILKSRLLGKLGPNDFANRALFVDRMFTLEHNNGCFLNKLPWANISDISEVLNAHSNDDLSTLRVWASSEVYNLFLTYYQGGE